MENNEFLEMIHEQLAQVFQKLLLMDSKIQNLETQYEELRENVRNLRNEG